MKNAEKMIGVIEKKILDSEYRTVTLKGIRNLSRSDLESAKMYAEVFIKNNGQGFGNFMEPMGSTKKLLEAFKVI